MKQASMSSYNSIANMAQYTVMDGSSCFGNCIRLQARFLLLLEMKSYQHRSLGLEVIVYYLYYAA